MQENENLMNEFSIEELETRLEMDEERVWRIWIGPAPPMIP